VVSNPRHSFDTVARSKISSGARGAFPWRRDCGLPPRPVPTALRSRMTRRTAIWSLCYSRRIPAPEKNLINPRLEKRDPAGSGGIFPGSTERLAAGIVRDDICHIQWCSRKRATQLVLVMDYAVAGCKGCCVGPERCRGIGRNIANRDGGTLSWPTRRFETHFLGPVSRHVPNAICKEERVPEDLGWTATGQIAVAHRGVQDFSRR